MGLYIEDTKELTKVERVDAVASVHLGANVDNVPFSTFRKDHLYPVCAVNNGPFIAVAVCYDQKEYDRFMYPDGRAKIWFALTKEKISELTGKDFDRYLLDTQRVI